MHKLLLDLPERFESERLYLRPYRAGDGPMYYQVGKRNRDHLERYETGNVLRNLENEAQAEIAVRDLWVDWQSRTFFFMGAFDKRTDEFVAQVTIGPKNWDLPEFEVGYIVDVEHEGQGFVSEAVQTALCFIFEHLGAYRVSLQCAQSNERSQRVAKRCGFQPEGTLRENKRLPNGETDSTLLFGLLASEYNC